MMLNHGPVPFAVRYAMAAFGTPLNSVCDALEAARGEAVIIDDRAYSDRLHSNRIRPGDHDDHGTF